MSRSSRVSGASNSRSSEIKSSELQRRLFAALEKVEVTPATVLPVIQSGSLLPQRKKHDSHSLDASVTFSSDDADDISSAESGGEAGEANGSGALQFVKRYWIWIAILLILLAAVIYFWYTRKEVIEKLGLGYGLATLPPQNQMRSLGAKVAGVTRDQMDNEMDAVQSESHPQIHRDVLPKVKIEQRNSAADSSDDESEIVKGGGGGAEAEGAAEGADGNIEESASEEIIVE